MEMNCKVLLVSPYNAKRVGGIGTWSKSVLDYFEGSKEFSIIFQNTSNIFKGNINTGRVSRVFWGIEDTLIIIIRLFYNLLIKRPDVIHYTSSASLALMKDYLAITLAHKVFKKRFVIHWHFGRIPEICNRRDKEYRRLMNVIRMADKNIVLDEKSLHALLNEGCDNVFCIPNPMTSALYDATKDKDITKANKERQKGEVLFVGHIIENKGVLELVKSCANCAEVKKLILVGPVLTPMKEKIIKLSLNKPKPGWVEFKGELQREDVYSYFRKCTIFCLPSYTEGFPYVILEAMAFGCPIIATDVGAIPEMLQEGSGQIIEPRNELQLTEILNKTLLDKEQRDKLGTNAYKRVMSVYTREAICGLYAKTWLNN